jgi:hypothetical protein
VVRGDRDRWNLADSALRVGAAVVTVVLCASALVSCGSSDQRPGIVAAVRAPLIAYMNRDADRLCSSLTADVARRLVSGTPSCGRGAAAAFADTAYIAEHYGPRELPAGLRINVLSVHGDRASVSTTWPWPDVRSPVQLTLESANGRWRIATATKLMDFVSCVKWPESAVQCSTGHGIEFGDGPSSVREPTRILRRSDITCTTAGMQWCQSRAEGAKR